MDKNPGDSYIIPIMAALLIVSLFFGMMFPFAVLMTVGLAAIQAGVQGLRGTGYRLGGRSILTGKPAQMVGGVAIAIGVAWEIVLIGYFIYGISWIP